MSSQSGASPPQSAQPYRSIFGGSSSQNVPESEPASQTHGGYGVTKFDSDDDSTYVPSDAEFPEHPQYKASSPSSFVDHTVEIRVKKQEEERAGTPESIEYRPNRFHGPDSTWRKLTREDRENAKALEKIRARDLAVHLFNAYALRCRAREAARFYVGDTRGRSRDPDLFAPPPNWTAWPVPMEEVPRANKQISRFEDDIWTLKLRPDSRGSAELEECIIASMLKTAKERFHGRDWIKPDFCPRRRSPQRETDEEGWESNGGRDPDIFLRPAVQADDDKSRQQLRPLARNIISQFEQLLLGLRAGSIAQARKRTKTSKNTTWDSDSSVSETDAEGMYSESSSSGKRRLRGVRDRSQSRGRKRMRKPERETNLIRTSTRRTAISEDTGSDAISPSQSQRASRSYEQPEFRDWNAVVGTASLLGWPQEVVLRTAQRCAALFGQDMAFRTFDDTAREEETNSEEINMSAHLSKSRSQSRRPRSRAASSKARSASRAASSAPEQSDGSKPKGKGPHRKLDLVCPIRSCSRHSAGFSRRWNLNQHMKKMHPSSSYRRGRSTHSHAASTPGSGYEER